MSISELPSTGRGSRLLTAMTGSADLLIRCRLSASYSRGLLTVFQKRIVGISVSGTFNRGFAYAAIAERVFHHVLADNICIKFSRFQVTQSSLFGESSIRRTSLIL